MALALGSVRVYSVADLAAAGAAAPGVPAARLLPPAPQAQAFSVVRWRCAARWSHDQYVQNACATTVVEPAAAPSSCEAKQAACAKRGQAAVSAAELEQQVALLIDLVAMQQRQLKLQQEQLEEQNAKLLRLASHQQQHAPARSAFEAQRIGFGVEDRRKLGLFDARFHSTSMGATPRDLRVLPERIFLVRHAESEGNVDSAAYASIPDSQVPLTDRGVHQARAAGIKIRQHIEERRRQRHHQHHQQHHMHHSHAKNNSVGRSNGFGSSSSTFPDYKLFFFTSPYLRSLQTYENISAAFPPECIMGAQEEVQLREQDFGNFQSGQLQREKAERLRFGRFYYRFPSGESTADVYDRITVYSDHLIRDINAGRFSVDSNLVLVTHGLALRVFLMRWFHWTVEDFLKVYNPDNAEPLVLERVPSEADAKPNGEYTWCHTKALYRLAPESMEALRGCTSEMCETDHTPRPLTVQPRRPKCLDEGSASRVPGLCR